MRVKMQSVEQMMHVASSLFLRMNIRKKSGIQEFKQMVNHID